MEGNEAREDKRSHAQFSPFIRVKGLIYESCKHYRLWKDLAIWKGFLLLSWLGGEYSEVRSNCQKLVTAMWQGMKSAVEPGVGAELPSITRCFREGSPPPSFPFRGEAFQHLSSNLAFVQ